MKRRAAVYSSSKRLPVAPAPAPRPAASAGKAPAPARRIRLPSWTLMVASLALLGVVALGMLWAMQPHGLNGEEVAAVVKHTLEIAPPPPSAAQAYEKILPSVVAVRARGEDAE